MRPRTESSAGESAACGAGVRRRCSVGVVLLVLAAHAANAQALREVVQDLRLGPGWNAVYLRVDAPLEQRMALLEGAAVSRVLMETGTIRSGTGEFDAALAGDDWPEAALWTGRQMDTDDDAAVRAAAEALDAGRCYLMEAGARSPVEVRLTGAPSARAQRWRGLAGVLFAGHGDGESTVGSYFEASPVLRDAEAYALTPENGWRLVEDGSRLDPNRCLFVKAPGQTRYQGPVEVAATGGDGLVFTDGSTEQYLRIENRTGEAASVTLRTPRFPYDGDDDGFPALFAWSPERAAAITAGLLSPAQSGATGDATPWGAIDESGTPIRIPARSTLHLRIGANVPAALEWRRGVGESEAPVRSVLSVEGPGVRYELPITIHLRPSVPPGERDTALAGLWVGDVFVDRVSYAESDAAPLMPVPRAFQFRLILHMGGTGECSVLSDAIEMETVEGERYILTEEDAARTRAGRGETARLRVRTVAYVTDGAVAAEPEPSGDAPECLVPGSSVSFRLRLGYDHPLNPDLHGAHPDHDNLDDRYENKLPEGVEAATIERVFRLSVARPSSPRDYTPEWSAARIAGDFSEAITGVHRRELKTGGRFFLFRLSNVERVER